MLWPDLKQLVRNRAVKPHLTNCTNKTACEIFKEHSFNVHEYSRIMPLFCGEGGEQLRFRGLRLAHKLAHSSTVFLSWPTSLIYDKVPRRQAGATGQIGGGEGFLPHRLAKIINANLVVHEENLEFQVLHKYIQ